ncbi:MAG: transglycosylase SLT domain-containing protein [Clostridia bacterium]
MTEDKVYVLRKTLVILTVILLFITAGVMVISTQIKTVTLNYYGEVKNVKTLSTTVDGFLMQNKIYVTDDTLLNPSKDQKVTDNMEIKLTNKNKLSKIDIDSKLNKYVPMIAKSVEVIDSIPFTEEKVNNPAVNRGITKVVNEGSNGEKSTKYLIKYNGNTEVAKVVIEENIKAEVVNKKIEVGTKLNPVVSRSSNMISVDAITVDTNFKKYNIKLPLEQQQYTYNMCKKYGVNYELMLAIMYKESGYNPSAFGGGNSYGLCQIHISNHGKLRSKLGVSNFFDPYDNITAGVYMFSIYLNSARKVVGSDLVNVYALNSYNMGEGSYFTNCYSRGVIHRGYSTSILNIRDRLLTNGGI